MDGKMMDRTSETLCRIQALAPLVAQHRPEFDVERRLSQPVVDAMVDADLFRLWTPAAFGGAEMSPRDFVEVVEAASALDGSFGWCLTNANASGQLAAYLPEPVARAWTSTPDCQMSGSTAALGTARRTKGGFIVTGRWPFASGIMTARRVNCLCKIEGEGDPANPVLIFCHFEVGEVTIVDTWHVSGLKGTGSNDFTVTEHFVPESHTHAFVGAEPGQPGQLYRFPIVSLLTLSVGIVPLGIAKSAVDAFIATADRTRAGTTNPLKDRETIQADLARAEAMRRAGKALILSALTDLEEALDIGGETLVRARAFFRVALAHSAETCVKAVDMLVACAGAAALFESSPLSRIQRDIHAATKHVAVAPHLFGVGGRIMLGLDPGAPRF